MYDVLIIGGGITGSSIAYELSKYKLKVALVEKENDVAVVTTKANSGIVHAGYDPKPNTLMAKLNVLGSKMYKELAPLFHVHYSNIGSLVVGREEDEDKVVELYNRGLENKVEDMSILRGEEIFKIEPTKDGMTREDTWLDTKYIKLPDVVGLSIEEAKEKLKGFKIEYSGNGNKVIHQSPEGNQYIKDGNTIKLMLNQ